MTPGPDGTRRAWRIPRGFTAPAPLDQDEIPRPRSAPSADPAPFDPAGAVDFRMRAQVRALSDMDGEPMNTTAITLWECSGCPGVVVWGDRLHEHQGHHDRERDR